MLKLIPYPQKIKILEGQAENLDNIEKKIKKTGLGKEGYRLFIKDKVVIEAEHEAGLFYAQKTLEQLKENLPVPYLEIEDKPKYSHRGYMLDCSRHFFTIEEIKKQIDMLALFKINMFHWHLTNDQGWRVQIDKYPLLTEIGSQREQTAGDKTPVKGFYTKEQIKEIVEYCKERHIEVIPEIDMPGHFSAAIASILSCHAQKKR
jgi:hexosaminidase